MPYRADLAEIDRRIVAAYTELNVARARFYLNPCGEIVTACEQAEATVNELLELRYALTRSSVAPPLQAA
jgi:predicted MarR family transcription regulator